jgi:hypothetical protein
MISGVWAIAASCRSANWTRVSPWLGLRRLMRCANRRRVAAWAMKRHVSIAGMLL